MDGKTVSEWIAQLKSPQPKDASAATRALLKIGSPAVPALVKALEETKDDGFRSRIFATFERMGPRAHDAVPTLTRLMKSNADGDRMMAAFLLGKIGPQAKSAAPELLEGLKDKNSQVRSACAESLGSVRADADVAVGPLTSALKDENFHVRQGAADGLYLLGPAAKAAVPALRQALKDPEFVVRRAAEGALKRVNPGEVIDVDINRQDAPKAPSDAPPSFVKFKGFDKTKNVITLHIMRAEMVSVVEGEKTVEENGKTKKVPVIGYKTVTVEHHRNFPVDELKFYDGEGKPLEKKQALDRLAQGGMALLSGDGEAVNPAYVQLLQKNVVIVTSPAVQR